jgi:hypothetical protein
MDNNNFQGLGAVSNAHAGSDFEAAVQAFFGTQGIVLTKNFAVPVGVGATKKSLRFDLGSETPPVLVECKSHTWTQGGNMPSAKMTVERGDVLFSRCTSFVPENLFCVEASP